LSAASVDTTFASKSAICFAAAAPMGAGMSGTELKNCPSMPFSGTELKNALNW
jgi:hypothetical protein